MALIRPIRREDLDALESLSASASIGITSLPKRREALAKKIEASLEAFSKNVSQPGREEYIFVLEHAATQEIGGTCSICARSGLAHSLYFYRLETLFPLSFYHLPLPSEMEVLIPSLYEEGPSEICALFLHPSYRREGWGKLLSLSRFLFIACQLHRFTDRVVAEMQGPIDRLKRAPFWEGLGRRFLDVEFEELLYLIEEKGRHFIPEIIPQWPIYVSLLPHETQAAIGKTHEDSKPALRLLEKQGFLPTREIDLFDGGPKVEATTEEITTIKESIRAPIASLVSFLSGEKILLANESINFRACYGALKMREDGSVVLTNETAETLQVDVGDFIRYIPLSLL